MPLTTMSPTIKNRLTFVLQLLFLLALGGLLYAKVLHGPFVFDDIFYIVRNPAIKHLGRLDTIFISNISSLRFLPFLSFALNYHFHQLEVFGYHLVNVVIHAVNALLVWYFVYASCQSPRVEQSILKIRPATLAYMTALVFLAHPVQTQAVSYITQRFSSMATLFYLGALCFYAAYCRRKEWGFLIGVFLCGVCAAFSKQIALTLPLMLVVYDRLFFPSSKKRIALVGVLALLLFLIIPAYYSFNVINILSLDQPSKSHLGDTLTSGSYFLTQFRVVLVYLKILLYPFTQNFLYDFPASVSLWEWKALLSVLAVIGFFVFSIFLVKTNRLAGFGFLWFFIALSVESSVIVIGHVIFEHRVYLPSVGFLTAVCALTAQFARSKKEGVLILTGAVALLSLLTWARNDIYTSRAAFWQDVLKKSPGLLRPYLNLGAAYLDEGKSAEALVLFNKAIAIDPRYAEAYNNRGLVYMRQGRFQEALKEFTKAIDLNKTYFNAYHNRGVLHLKAQRSDKALLDFNKVLELNVSHPESYNERAGIYFANGQVEKALEDYSKAILYDPSNAMALNNKGAVYNSLGEYDIAVRDLKSAIKLDSSFSAAYYNLSYTQYKRGKMEEARINLQKAVDLGYNVDKGYYHLIFKGE